MIGALVFLVFVASLSDVWAQPPGHAQWELTFADEFDGESVDWEVWESQAGPRRLEGRWPENNVIQSGVLHQVTRREVPPRGGKDWSTAHIWTREFAQQYGYFECRMRYGLALNNAFWLVRPSNRFERPHFEIDVNEGHTPSQIAMTYHRYLYHDEADWRELVSLGGTWEAPVDLSEDFHTYGAEWDAERIIWYFDGEPLRVLTGHGAHAPADVRLSTVIHTTTLERQDIPLAEVEGSAMSTDWVRVYRKVRDLREREDLPEPVRFELPRIAETQPQVDAGGALRAVLSEDFDAPGALAEGWDVGEGEPRIIATDERTVLQLEPDDYVFRIFDEPIAGRLRVEFDCLTGGRDENLLLVTLGEFDPTDTEARRLSYYTGDIGPYIHWKGHYLRYYTEQQKWTRIGFWPGGEWARVRVLLDISRGVFDVYRIEGGEAAFVGSGPFRHGQEAAHGIGLRHRGSGSPVLIDDLTVEQFEE